MSQNDERRLIYFENEEHLVRRLGAALISYWKELPVEFQAKLIERAESVLDKDQSSHLDKEMKHFIAANTRQD